MEPSTAKSLFLGKLVSDSLHPFPSLDSEEGESLQMILKSVNKFMQGREKDFRDYDRDSYQPEDFIQSLKELGLFGIIIPEEFDGFGLSSKSYARILEEVSAYDGGTSLTIGAHSSIGLKGLLLFGTEEQKTKYLPSLACGETIAAFCLTEPGAGSDAASIKTSATKQADGSWLLNGEKIWITNGGIAGFYTVFARTDSQAGKITAFIVESGWAGVSFGPKEDKMGIRASNTTTVSFENVTVPPDAVLGEEGHGFKIAMQILNNGRTGLGGGCVGAMKRCIGLASAQANNRKQFGRAIGEFGLVREKISQMTVDAYSTESAVYTLAHLIDSGSEDFSVEAAICKVYASQSLWAVANEALQIAGGNGYMKDYPYEKIVRDARINLIFEGTNEILRLYIALSGLKDAGDYFKGLKQGVSNIFNDPIKGFGLLSGYASKKALSFTPLGKPKLKFIPQLLASEALIMENYTLRFSRAVEEVLKRLGKKVVEEQFILKRLADIAIDLFVAHCLLSRVSSSIAQQGEQKAQQEIQIARIFMQQAKRRMNQNLRRLITNEDEVQSDLAKSILEKGGYKWDFL